MLYELSTQYDSRKSFYGKAIVETVDNGLVLWSYGTKVAAIFNGVPVVYGTHSATTLRHIKEFLRQAGFNAGTKSQILADYSPEFA